MQLAATARGAAPRRLTFVPSYLRGFGGVEQMLVAAVVVAEEAGWDVRVVSPRRLEPGGPLDEALRPHAQLRSAEASWQRRPSGRVLRAAAHARERIRTGAPVGPARRANLAGERARRYVDSYWDRGAGRRLLVDTDLVYVLAPHPFGARAMAAAARLDVPVVYEVTSAPSPSWATDPYYAPIREALAGADAVVVRSSSIGEAVAAVQGYDGALTVLDQWVDPSLEADLVALPPVDPAAGPLRVGSLSRVVERKGLEVLVDAVAGAIHGGHDLRLVIAGEGPLEASLRARADDRGVTDRVELPGEVAPDDRAAFYASVDVFVLASESEGGPVTTLEAMAAGRAVITTPVGAMRDRLTSGEGLFFEVGDVEGLRAHVARLAEDRPAVRALGAAAREAYLARNTAAGQAARLDAVWHSLVER